MRVLLVLALLALSACTLPADPCPLPVSEHPDVWKPIVTAKGDTIGWACMK